MAIESQEQFEKLRAALKAGKYTGDPELQDELIRQAQEFKALQIGRNQFANDELPQGGNIADALGQGALFGFSDEIAGALGATVGTFDPALEDTTFGERFRGIRDAARENARAFAERNPGTALAAEIGGGVLTGGVGAARAGAFQAAKNAPTLVGKLRPIVATGAIQGGIFGAGKSEAEELRGVARDAAQGAGIGAITAPVIPILAGGTRSVVSRAVQAKDSKPFRDAVRLLEDKIGIKLTTGQKTGSDAIKTLETTLSPTFIGQSINRTLDTNRAKFQGELMRLAGFQPGDISKGLVTRRALDNAQERFSRRYSELLKGRSVDISGDDFLNRLGTIEAENLSRLPTFQKKQIIDLVDDFLDTAMKGPMSARAYQLERSRLGQLSQSFRSSQPHLSQMYRGMKKALDDAFAEAAQGKNLRGQLDKEYGRFKQLINAFEASGSQQSSEGFLPLAMILRRSRKSPDREFENLIEAGQMVLGEATPNSGTASRALNNLLAFGGPGAAAFDPTIGAATLGVPFGTSLALSRGLTGGQSISRAIQSGLLTAPITTSLLGDFQ